MAHRVSRRWHLHLLPLAFRSCAALKNARALMVEVERAMYEKVFENLRKATEASVQAQQEIFQQWVSLWRGVPSTAYASGGKIQEVQEKWNQTVTEQVKKQRESLEAQF